MTRANADEPPAPTEDDRLVAACAGGDQPAFAELVRRHSARVHALALRMTGSAADAEEVSQEAFWRVWSSAGRWQPGGAQFSTWLYRIVVNLCIDRDRRARIRRFIQLDETHDAPDPAIDQEQHGEHRQELARVLRAMDRLPARQRAALLLSAEGEQSNKEIAQALGTTEKGVESMLVRARRTLRAVLGAEERGR